MMDQLTYVVLMAIIVIPVIVFRWQIRRVQSGVEDRFRGSVMFLVYALLPVLAYVAVFMALVGLEELADRSIIGEGFARGLVPIVVMSVGEVLLLTLIFAVVVSFVRKTGQE